MERYKKLTLLHSNDLHGDFLIGEVKSSNIASNKISELLGERIINGDINYYLFPKNRISEFNKDHLFEEAMKRPTRSNHEILEDIKKRERKL